MSEQQNMIDGLTAQLDAHREQLAECLNSMLNAKANVSYLKKMLDAANKLVSELTHKPEVKPETEVDGA